jgi:PAS domain S-box-containing protein
MDQFEKLLNEIGSSLVFYETGGNQEFISENIFDLTGYYSEEIRLNRDLFPGLINPEDYIETNFKIKNWHKQSEPGVLTMEFRIRSVKGIQIWLEDHLIGMKKNDAKFMQGIMINVNPLKERFTALLQLRTEWNDREDADLKEKEIVFKDIQRQLSDMEKMAAIRHEKIGNFLEYVKKENISFEEKFKSKD